MLESRGARTNDMDEHSDMMSRLARPAVRVDLTLGRCIEDRHALMLVGRRKRLDVACRVRSRPDDGLEERMATPEAQRGDHEEGSDAAKCAEAEATQSWRRARHRRPTDGGALQALE